MHRYIAFAWNHQSAEKTSLAKTLLRRLHSTLPEWQCALDTEGLHVYHSGDSARSSRTYVLKQSAGVILGRLFERREKLDGTDSDCSVKDVTFDRQETTKIRDTKGRRLIDNYWGRYVAILTKSGGSGARVLRDPTGAMPCLLTKFEGIDIVCSNIEDCATIGLVNNTINWDHIVAYLWFHRLVTKDTGLDGVSQVQAGECVTVGTDRTESTYYWRPDRIHDVRILEDRQQAILELRNTVQHCIGTWGACYDNILHELSGGLDSAVVLASLSGAPNRTNIVCENFFTQSREGDERVFAQQAADQAGVELITTPMQAPEQVLEGILDYTKVASPTRTHLVLGNMNMITRERLAKARGIDAMFSGQGGDHFFQQESTALIAAEYAWRHGIRPGILSAIADTSRFTRQSVWSVMTTTLTAGLLRRREEAYDKSSMATLLFSEATRDVLDLDNIRHPWIESAKHLPGAKVRQILNTVDSQNFYNFPCQYADVVHPLISQPIIELCLQIPSYVLTYGGIDRALVRDAFSELVPPEIARRTVKGATTNFVNRMLTQNLPFLREFLLEGNLLREGVLDREKTETALTESGLVRNPHLLFPIINAIRAETWLRAWSDGRRRAAA